MTIIITHGIVETLAAGGIVASLMLFVAMLATDDWSSDRPVPPLYAKPESRKAMGYPVGPTPEVPLRAPETRFYAPGSLTLPDWVCGPVTAKLYRLQLDRAAQIRELVSGIPPYREPTVADLAVVHKTGLPPSHLLKLETFRK